MTDNLDKIPVTLKLANNLSAWRFVLILFVGLVGLAIWKSPEILTVWATLKP